MRLLRIISLLLAFTSGFGKTIFAESSKPNVLWVLTDDQRYDAIRTFNKMLHNREMSELGYVESPNIDRLADEGVTFINTYCQAQGCAPSRASMHYGRYPFRSGIYEFEYHNNNTNNSYPHLPEQMAKLGYQTVHVGKLGVRLRTIVNGNAVKPEIYQTDFDSSILSDEGLAEWGKVTISEIDGVKLDKTYSNIKYLRTDDGKMYYISEELESKNPQFAGMAQEAYNRFDLLRKHTDNTPETVFSSGILAGLSPRGFGKTRDGYYSSVFKDFLENENRSFKVGALDFDGVDTNKPLFCHIGYDFPHTPVLPPAEYRERFQQHAYNVPDLTDEEWAKMPKQLQKQVKASRSSEFTEAQKQKMVQDYYAFCAYGDSLVGQAVEAFKAYSENHNQPWIIVYVCGDHGWKLNEHGAYSKFTPWEIDSHNPIIVVSSDKEAFPSGKVVEDYTEFVDIYPTILSAAGLDVESTQLGYLDGLDLKKVASGEAPKRDYVIGESHAVTGPRAFLRTKDFVFSMQTRPDKNRGENMEWARTASYEDIDPGLYHMPSDHHETNNLAFNQEFEKIAMKMKEKLINIVLGDNRAEVMWGGDNYGTNTKAIGTEVHRSNFAPGAHDYKLNLQYEYDPKSTEEFRMRSGLPNFFTKVNQQDTIRVGYVGGSITAGDDEWSRMTFDWLKQQYPESHFEIINIAVPGTPVTVGAFRIASEMLVYKPDLVFIEYRVNGLGDQGMKGPEGMIRQIYRDNPKTDICIVYTISQNMLETIRNGEQTSVGEVMETAANYYGIPSIDMGVEVVKLLDDDKLIFKGDELVEGKILFSNDGVHPIEGGDKVYTDVVTRNLLKMEQYASSKVHNLPEPMDAENFEYPTIRTVDDVSKSSNWELVDTNADEIYRSGRWRSDYVLVKPIKCDKVGETLTFNWKGFALCLTTIPQGEGMTVEITTDGGTAKEYVFSQQGTGNKYGSYMFYPPFLEDDNHTTTVKITKLPNNSTFYFGQFYTMQTQEGKMTGIKPIKSGKSLNIYPNPVRDFMTIQGIANIASYSIYDINGKQVQQGVAENNLVDTSSIPKGMYFFKMDNSVAKFVKG